MQESIEGIETPLDATNESNDIFYGDRLELTRYWQERCIINENMLDLFMIKLSEHYPHIAVVCDDLNTQWQRGIDALEDRHGLNDK